MVKRSENAGFTLLEVMAAVSVIAIALVAVYQLYAQSIRLSAAADFYTTAPLLANKILGKIEPDLTEIPVDDSGDFEDNFPAYSWKVTFEDVDLEMFQNSDQKMIKIDLTISFNDEEDIYQLTTYRFLTPEK